MKISIKLLLILIMCMVILFFSPRKVNRFGGEFGGIEMKADKARLTTLYDNYAHSSGLKTGWGFSCFIELENETILFDTGGDSDALLYNMKKLGKDPKAIDNIVLSHIHGDHTGGLRGVLEVNPDVTVYLPESFPESFKDDVKSHGSKVVEVRDSIKISENVISTGELGFTVKEQSLVISTEKGLVVITGCAHPGVANIVKEVKKLVNGKMYLVLGGFHLAWTSDSGIRDIIKSFRELGVRKVSPSHCSGDRAKELFAEEYEDDFIDNGVGMVIEL